MPARVARPGKPLQRWIGVFGLLLAAAFVVAASGHTRQTLVRPLAPLSLEAVRQQAEALSNTDRPVAVVLGGGGGLRGFAHIGVLRALEEHGVRPDIVVGTSAGALVGAAYASGRTVEQLEAAATSIDISALIDLTLDEGGLMRGDEIARWIDGATQGRRIEDFPIRFGAVATDIGSGEALLLASGATGDAVRASAAVPGATVPVAYSGGHLVDSGVSSLVPVRFARAMGARVVIAVDIYCNDDKPMALSAHGVVRRSMRLQTCLLAESELSEADIAVRVDVPMPMPMSEVSSKQMAIDAGYAAANAALGAHESTLH